MAGPTQGQKHWPPIETHLIQSCHVRQTFKVSVMQPARWWSETNLSVPVVYATDGNFMFDVLKGLAHSMQLAEPDTPRFMLVGIGYPGDAPLAGALLRCRDLTFPGYPRLSTQPPPFGGVLAVEEGTKDFAAAPDFQRFLGEELIPFIDEKYATVPGDRTYFGHSAGGGFGLFTLFTAPQLFRNYIVSSPGLIYHGRSSAGVDYDDYDFLPAQARAFIAAGTSLDGVRLYMSVGTEEELETSLVQWRLTSSFYRMVALLKSAPTLRLAGLTAEALAGETHDTAWPIAFMHGVRAVFRDCGRRVQNAGTTG